MSIHQYQKDAIEDLRSRAKIGRNAVVDGPGKYLTRRGDTITIIERRSSRWYGKYDATGVYDYWCPRVGCSCGQKLRMMLLANTIKRIDMPIEIENSDEFYKALRVIKSCATKEQLPVAERFSRLVWEKFKKAANDEQGHRVAFYVEVELYGAILNQNFDIAMRERTAK